LKESFGKTRKRKLLNEVLDFVTLVEIKNVSFMKPTITKSFFKAFIFFQAFMFLRSVHIFFEYMFHATMARLYFQLVKVDDNLERFFLKFQHYIFHNAG